MRPALTSDPGNITRRRVTNTPIGGWEMSQSASMKRAAQAGILAVLLLAGGCRSFIYGTTGRVMAAYTIEVMLPTVMASGDIEMACGAGESLGSMVVSFDRVTNPIDDKPAMLTMMSAGMCAEADAWEAELAGGRARFLGQAAVAQDERVKEMRARQTAAARYAEAWQRFRRAYQLDKVACPKFKSENDEVLTILGLSSGLLATMNDRASGGSVGLVGEELHQVERLAQCLDNTRYWGAPKAFQAAVWASVPGATPEGSDPWVTLAAAADASEATGVRLAQALFAQVAAAQGKSDMLRKVLRQHAASLSKVPTSKQWTMLDRYATNIITYESDRLWTANTGHRTPHQGLGTFWDEAAKVDDGGLLDNLTKDPS